MNPSNNDDKELQTLNPSIPVPVTNPTGRSGTGEGPEDRQPELLRLKAQQSENLHQNQNLQEPQGSRYIHTTNQLLQTSRPPAAWRLLHTTGAHVTSFSPAGASALKAHRDQRSTRPAGSPGPSGGMEKTCRTRMKAGPGLLGPLYILQQIQERLTLSLELKGSFMFHFCVNELLRGTFVQQDLHLLCVFPAGLQSSRCSSNQHEPADRRSSASEECSTPPSPGPQTQEGHRVKPSELRETSIIWEEIW